MGYTHAQLVDDVLDRYDRARELSPPRTASRP